MADTERLKKYEQIKLNVLTVLNITAKYVTVDELENTYKKLHNVGIPFRDAGFSSALDLLKSFPSNDIEFKNIGYELCCKSITKECFKHVTSLIKKTKPTKPIHYKKYPPLETFNPDKDKNALVELKKEVRELLMSYPLGLHIRTFSDAYARRFGHYINFGRYTFKNIEGLVKSMPDIISIKDGNILSLMNALNYEKKNPIPGIKPLMATPLLATPSLATPSLAKPLLATPSLAKPLLATPSWALPSMARLLLATPSLTMPSLAEKYEKQKIETTKEVIDELSVVEREKVFEVLSNHPEGILSYEFAKIFWRETGLDVPGKWSNHGLLLKGMQGTSGVICIEYNSFYWFFHSKTPRDLMLLDSKRAGNAYMWIVRRFFYDVLFNNPSGMPKEDAFNLFKKHHGEEINISSLGLSNSDFLLHQMSDFLQMKYLGAGKSAIEMKSYKDPELNASLDPQFILSDSVVNGPYTHDVLKVPKNCPIMVCQVEYSGEFYFQLYSQKKVIDDLMDSLSSFYSSNSGNRYRVPKSYLKPNLICAAKFEGLWHRCIVEEVCHDEVKVFYVDYGTRHKVLEHELRFLRKKYVALMAQAYKARLAGVTPIGPNRALSKDAFEFVFTYMCNNVVNSNLYGYTDDGAILLDMHFQSSHLGDLPETNSRRYTKLSNVMLEKGFVEANKELDVLKAKAIMMKKMNRKDLGISEGFKEQVTVQPITVPPKNVTKFTKLTEENDAVIINLNDVPYIASCDFSSFLWDYDVACTVIMDISGRLKLQERDHPDLFRRLMAEIPRLKTGNDGRKSVTLFTMDFAAEFLEMAGHRCEKLKLAMQRAVDLFDPNDPHWTGQNGLDTSLDRLDSFEKNIDREGLTSRTRSKGKGITCH